MKGMKILAAAACISLALGGTAQAIEFTDVQQLDQVVGFFDSYSGSFNIVSPGSSSYTISGFSSGNGTFTDAGGYTLGTPLSSATASFYIYAPILGFFDTVDINLNGIQVVDNGTGGLKWSWSQNFTVNGNNAVLSVLEDNGTLGYQVSSDTGGFILEYALLQVNTSTVTANVAAVPDGGTTVVLLGLGLVGIAVLNRKLASAKV